jgi:hypothetical protein
MTATTQHAPHGAASHPAQDIEAGDFTYCTGYRQVQRVVRRPRRREIRVYWRAGAQTFRYDTILKVRKP